MRHLDSFVLTLTGYLTCVLGPMALQAIVDFSHNDDAWLIAWTVGMGMHLIAAIRYHIHSESSGWNKFLYYVLPIPSGFILTLGGIAFWLQMWTLF